MNQFFVVTGLKTRGQNTKGRTTRGRKTIGHKTTESNFHVVKAPDGQNAS